MVNEIIKIKICRFWSSGSIILIMVIANPVKKIPPHILKNKLVHNMVPSSSGLSTIALTVIVCKPSDEIAVKSAAKARV
jgi:hypothetical protein